MRARDVVNAIHKKHPEWAKNNIGEVLQSMCEEIRREVETADVGTMVKVPFLGRIKIKETPREDGDRRYVFLPAKSAEVQAEQASLDANKPGPGEGAKQD